ncbi:MAG: HAMP domain-containing protein [Alphaproteobacteria bacterium]|nr:HAMP domain-containing protein [Alphaproteobacteria bacterium]
MSIKQKLFIGFGVLILLSLVQGGIAIKESKGIGQLVTETYDKSLMSINFARSAQSNFLLTDRLVAAAIQNPDLAKNPDTLEGITESSEAVGEDLDVAKERSVKKRSLELIDKVVGQNEAWLETATEGLKTLAESKDRGADLIVLQKSLSGQSKAVLEAIGLLIEYASEDGYVFSQEAKKQVDLTVLLSMIAAGAVAALGLIIAALLGFGISRPLNSIRTTMMTIADGDKSVEIPSQKRKDEVGDIARTLEQLKISLLEAEREREAAQLEREEKRKQEAKRDQKEREVEQMKAAEREREELERVTSAERKDEIISAFNEQIIGVIESLGASATQMQSSATTMSSSADQTNKQAAAVASAADAATGNVQTVASAAEELSASIGEISRQVVQCNEIAQNAVTEAKDTNEKVEGLAEAAQKIGDVVSLINDIASQTNLLALNATIEAARAGDAGKGFAVVASEVKSLATQTGKATEEIDSQITSMQAATGEAVQAIQGIGSTIGEIGEIATSVATAVNEQGAATREIASSVQQAAVGTKEVSSNIVQVTEAAAESQEASDNLLTAVNDMAKQGDVLREVVDQFLEQVRAA